MKHIARKRFGQNFLQDQQVINSIIAEIAPQPEDHIIEIGPGLGALTQPLLNRCHLTLIELDRDLIPHLNKLNADLTIINADVLTVNFHQLAKSPHKLRLVGNLPYNISTPLLFHVFQYCKDIADMHFMLQKEVAERLVAPANSSHYGRLSIMTQYFCEIDLLLEVPPQAFNPMPQVQSAIVRLVPHPPQYFSTQNFALFETLIRHAFSQRRKTLRNNLKHWLSTSALQTINEYLSHRPQELTVNQYISIANLLADSCYTPPN
ncbi:MAG: 16S rRNA (adenine(1518)-N(6)/adenine(1519)-N(6)) -dimethyltransferase RsmA [Gammaproteobacteria bacterium]